MPESNVAALLTNYPITKTLKCTGQPICRNAARQFHASTGISSSLV